MDYYKFRAEATIYSTSGVSTISKNYLIDSYVEDERDPSSGDETCVRSGSGKGQFPAFGTSPAGATYGSVFTSSVLLTATNNEELQFSNQYFHYKSDGITLVK